MVQYFMSILIDGHNLIGQLPGISLADPDDEAQLVLLLRRYAARRKGRKLVVIFDNGVYGHPDNLSGYGVEVRFARSPADADSELIKKIRSIRRRDEWLVVSSDHAVVGEARAHHIPVVTSQEFARRLQALEQAHTLPGPADSTERPLSRAELQDWLRLFGVEPGTEED